MMKKIILFILLFFLVPFSVFAVILEGNIYDSNLDIAKDVLVEINTIPLQKILAVDGSYSFSLPLGEYILTVQKEDIIIKEKVKIIEEGTFIFDIFLLPDFLDEDELWAETNEDFFTKESNPRIWAYLIAGIIFLFAFFRIFRSRKKYGPLPLFKLFKKRKTVEQHKKELANQPGYINEVISIIKKYDGRISQKELRKEMMPLSEAKISLIITELEHKGLVEKIKKGRGNVLLLK